MSVTTYGIGGRIRESAALRVILSCSLVALVWAVSAPAGGAAEAMYRSRDGKVAVPLPYGWIRTRTQSPSDRRMVETARYVPARKDLDAVIEIDIIESAGSAREIASGFMRNARSSLYSFRRLPGCGAVRAAGLDGWKLHYSYSFADDPDYRLERVRYFLAAGRGLVVSIMLEGDRHAVDVLRGTFERCVHGVRISGLTASDRPFSSEAGTAVAAGEAARRRTAAGGASHAEAARESASGGSGAAAPAPEPAVEEAVCDGWITLTEWIFETALTSQQEAEVRKAVRYELGVSEERRADVVESAANLDKILELDARDPARAARLRKALKEKLSALAAERRDNPALDVFRRIAKDVSSVLAEGGPPLTTQLKNDLIELAEFAASSLCRATPARKPAMSTLDRLRFANGLRSRWTSLTPRERKDIARAAFLWRNVRWYWRAADERTRQRLRTAFKRRLRKLLTRLYPGRERSLCRTLVKFLVERPAQILTLAYNIDEVFAAAASGAGAPAAARRRNGPSGSAPAGRNSSARRYQGRILRGRAVR